MHKAEKKKPQDDVNPKMGLRKLKPKQSKMNIYNTKRIAESGKGVNPFDNELPGRIRALPHRSGAGSDTN